MIWSKVTHRFLFKSHVTFLPYLICVQNRMDSVLARFFSFSASHLSLLRMVKMPSIPGMEGRLIFD